MDSLPGKSKIIEIVHILKEQFTYFWVTRVCVFNLFYSKVKGTDNQEKLVYQIIEDAGNKGELKLSFGCCIAFLKRIYDRLHFLLFRNLESRHKV